MVAHWRHGGISSRAETPQSFRQSNRLTDHHKNECRVQAQRAQDDKLTLLVAVSECNRFLSYIWKEKGDIDEQVCETCFTCLRTFQLISLRRL